MNVVYYLQAGEHGPVRIDTCEQGRLRMRIGQLQAGNPELLLVRALYEGDSAELADLRRRHAGQRIHDAWHAPAVLDALPDDLAAVPFDRDAEQRRVAVRAMQTLSLQGRP